VIHQHKILEENVYMWFGSNDTSGSGDDGASPLCDIREAGATITDAPILSPTPALISHVNFPPGCYEVDIPATAANGFAATKTYAAFCTLAVDSQNPTGFVGSFTLDPMIANLKEIDDDGPAAVNLEKQYDGTGLTGDTFPATQTQVSNLAIAGAAINTPAKDSPNGFVITKGENEANTENATKPLDGTTHDIEAVDDAGTERIEVYYEFDIGSGIPTSVHHHAYLDKGGGAAKNLTVWAWNWGTSQWRQIGTLNSGNSLETGIYDLFTAEVGTGTDIGTVRIRFLTGSVAFSATTKLLTDQIFVSYAQSVAALGFIDGAVWFDSVNGESGTSAGIGTVERPSDTIADAQIIAAANNLKSIHVLPGSTITMGQAWDGYTFRGDAYTINLNGKSVSGTIIEGATVNGNDDGSNGISTVYRRCTMVTNTLGLHHLEDCGLSAAITLAEAGTYDWVNCHSEVAGTATPSVDVGTAVGDTNLNMRQYSGGIEVKQMGDTGADLMSLEGNGQLIINANCSGGTIAIRGHFTVTDNASGVVSLSDDARYDIVQVNDQVVDVIDTVTSGEPAQGAYPVTASLRDKIDWMYKFAMNQIWSTANQISVYNAAKDTVDHKSATSDDGTTYKRGEFEGGP
jgi:hypothetical protein